MKGVFLIIGLVLLISGCLDITEGRLMESYDKAHARDIVESHIKKTPTYQVSGSSLTQVSMYNVNCGGGNSKDAGEAKDCWDASYSFVSEYDGYGYRDKLDMAETEHLIKVKLKGESIIYSIIDNKWDTLSQGQFDG